jgi:GT2 family glycosyltransferase
LKSGYSCRFFPEAWVFHKRRTDLKTFFQQVYHSGIARIHLYKRYPESLKFVHVLPAIVTLGILISLLVSVFTSITLIPIALYALFIVLDATWQTKNLKIGIYSVAAAFVQLIGYGTGFLRAWLHRCMCRRKAGLGEK